MKVASRLWLLSALVVGVALPAAAADQTLPKPTADFSADVVMTMEGMGTPEPMKIQGTVRYDTESGRYLREQSIMGQQSVLLQSADGKTTYMLMPALKSYMTMSEGGATEAGAEPTELEGLEKVGTEKLEGVEATKYKIATDEGTGYVWLTDDKVALKMELTGTKNGQTVRIVNELKNLKMAEQDSGDFEIPEGYTQMQMPTMPPPTGAAPQGGAPSAPPAAPQP